jgi:hypothetical protein
MLLTYEHAGASCRVGIRPGKRSQVVMPESASVAEQRTRGLAFSQRSGRGGMARSIATR